MQALSIEEVKTKYENSIEEFCYAILKDQDRAFITRLSVFESLVALLPHLETIKEVEHYLYFCARERCINYLRYLKLMHPLIGKFVRVGSTGWIGKLHHIHAYGNTGMFIDKYGDMRTVIMSDIQRISWWTWFWY